MARNGCSRCAKCAPIDWSDPFESYFLVGDDVTLPDAREVYASIAD